MVAVATKPYIETRNNGYYVVGTRISLDSVVYLFRDGQSPKSILQAFPLLTLEKIYGVIAFYLANSKAIDAYLLAEEKDIANSPNPLQIDDPKMYEELLAATKESTVHDDSH